MHKVEVRKEKVQEISIVFLKRKKIEFVSVKKMDRLWEKTHQSFDATFVNLFYDGIDGESYSNDLSHSVRGVDVKDQSKNNEISLKFRDEGNRMFKKKQWQDSMEYYNLSLRFAEPGTENMAKAYGNRSACFFNMQKYDKCLNDIDLAKEANYPLQLMHKLTEREVECIEKLEEKPDENVTMPGWELSYPAKKKFPGIANVLNLRYNEEYGRHIIANKDIDVGKTVLLDDANLFGDADGPENNYNFCDTCAKYETNLIPCPNCVSVMFCNEECRQNNKTHELICGETHVKHIIVQTILAAISAFDNNVSELMDFVVNMLADKTSKLPKGSNDVRLKYEFFLKQQALPNIVDEDEPLMVYQHLWSMKKIKNLFFCKFMEQRFLQHLIWQHTMIIHANLMIVNLKHTPTKLSKIPRIVSLLNHSCMPNVYLLDDGMKSIAITIRPVKKGEQLFIVYQSDMLHTRMDTVTRQKFLEEKFHFTCKCSKCLPVAKPLKKGEQPELKKLNQMYREILNKQTKIEFSNEKDRTLYMNVCCQFLNEFGHLPWSDLIENFMIRYIYCLPYHKD